MGKEVQAFTIAGNGKQVRDVLHAEDLIRLYQSAYQHRDQAAGEIFNIGGGIDNSLSLLELFEILQNKLDLPRPLEVAENPPRQSDQKWFVADISKASKKLMWAPHVDASTGLDRMLEWTSKSS